MEIWEAVKRRKLLVAVLTIAAFPAGCLSGACGAYRRPAAVTGAEQRLSASPPLPYSVSVIPWDAETGQRLRRDPEIYAKSLTTCSREATRFVWFVLSVRPVRTRI